MKVERDEVVEHVAVPSFRDQLHTDVQLLASTDVGQKWVKQIHH
jgi:hypothetical protein